MAFGTLLPLIALVGVPVIILLYMMKPKGKRKVIPSLLLWKDRERYDTEVTFARKLIKNILLILEILALLFLIFAAMSPKLKLGGATREDALLVIDTSGSMQFLSDGTKGGSGKTRFEEALSDARDYVELSSGNISIMSAGEKVELLANTISDKQKLLRALSDIEVTDGQGDINKAESIFRSLTIDRIIVYTDADGAEKLQGLAETLPMEVRVYGKEAANVGITQVSVKSTGDGIYDVAIGLNKAGEQEAEFDLSLYDEDGSLLEVRTVNTADRSQETVLMLDKAIKGDYIRAEISGIHFNDNNLVDGLERDNTGYASIRNQSGKTAYLVGVGNTYLEKAYLAATGENVIKVAADSEIKDESTGAIAIYDRADLVTSEYSRFVQAYHPSEAEFIEGAVVTVRTGQLINDMSDYTFGAGKLSVLDLPEWAEPLMVIAGENSEEKVVAYYGEQNGIRQIVLGFDIRDSEYPLMAEFPIFIADAVGYLSDESMLRDEYIQAGSTVSVSPSVSADAELKEAVAGSGKAVPIGGSIDHAGLYGLTYKKEEGSSQTEKTEYFVARYPVSEGDGTGTAESMSYAVQAEPGVRMSSLRRLALIIALLLLIADLMVFLFRFSLSKDEEKGIAGKLKSLGRCFLSRGILENAAVILLIILVALSIIEPALPSLKKKTATIFVLDMSDSAISTLPEQEAYLRRMINELPSGELLGVVTFGQNAVTEQFLTDDVAFSQIATAPDGTGTDIQGAIEYAAALLPDERTGRIVVLTDGKETIGDINGCLDILSSSGIELCGVLLDTGIAEDVYVEDVDMPEKLASGDAYVIKATIYSSIETDAVLSIWNGSELEEQKSVKLNKGDNTFLIDGVAGDSAVEEKRITVEAAGDKVDNNNSAVVAALVEAPQKVLLISGVNEDSSGFEHLLHTINTDVTTVSAINAPDNLISLLKYKTIIIDNAYITDLPEGFVNSISSYVKDYGGGLITTGGMESYAPGGYKDTPLEEVLPVDMLPKGVDEAPSMAMVMVIDCSGSMSGGDYDPATGVTSGRSKIDVAVDAAIEAVESMNRSDYVGVVTFSDNFDWRQPLVLLEDKDAVIETIEGIGIMGGTVIKPAVDSAATEIAKLDVGVKHILLLTDGQGETTDFDDVIKKINDNGITLSTVAVGSDSGTKLLEHLADKCGGRYYYSDSSSNIPKIFAEEVYLSGSTYYKKGDFAIHVNGSNKLVEGLYADGLPNISGYIGTTTKGAAREIITTDQDDPLLSGWQYGLGHTVAWMTNASGTWNESLSQMDDYAEMWKKILDYARMEGDLGQDIVDVYKRRDKLEISYTAADYSEATKVTGICTFPSGESIELPLLSEKPGYYTASFEPDEFGVYTVNIKRYEEDELVASATAIETLQFSDEYRQDISSAGFVSFVESHGRMLEMDSKVYTKILSKKRSRKDTTVYFIILAMVLLLAVICIRRFDLGRRMANAFAGRGKAAAVKGRAGRGRKKGTVGEGQTLTSEEQIQNIAGQGISGQNLAGQGMSGQNTAAQNMVGSNTAGQGMSGHNISGQGMSGQAEYGQADAGEESGRGKGRHNRRSKKQEVPADAGLDTSALLKKKKDRNL